MEYCGEGRQKQHGYEKETTCGWEKERIFPEQYT
jgi:hypothetical protein